jgi:hypothetical protein
VPQPPTCAAQHIPFGGVRWTVRPPPSPTSRLATAKYLWWGIRRCFKSRARYTRLSVVGAGPWCRPDLTAWRDYRELCNQACCLHPRLATLRVQTRRCEIPPRSGLLHWLLIGGNDRCISSRTATGQKISYTSKIPRAWERTNSPATCRTLTRWKLARNLLAAPLMPNVHCVSSVGGRRFPVSTPAYG